MRDFCWNGRLARTSLAADEEIFSVAGTVDDARRGVIQFGGDRDLGTQIARRSGRPVFHGNITWQAIAPDRWRQRLDDAEALMREGYRSYEFVMPRPGDLRYTLKTAQHFGALPAWKQGTLLPLEG